MTYEEKLKFAFNVVVKYGFCGDCRWTFNSDKCHEFDCYQNGVAIIKQALEKQIPKRTIYKHTNTRYTHLGRVRHDQFRCCNCGLTKEFVDGHTSQYKFCPQCGLKIDWSDEE